MEPIVCGKNAEMVSFNVSMTQQVLSLFRTGKMEKGSSINDVMALEGRVPRIGLHSRYLDDWKLFRYSHRKFE